MENLRPEGTRLLERLEALDARVRHLCGDLSADGLARQPSPGAWSIGAVLEHLLLAGEFYLDAMAAAVTHMGEGARAPELLPWRPSFFGGLLERSLRPESTRKLPAPRILQPAPAPRPDVVAAFLAQQSAVAERVRTYADLDWNRVRLGSPVNRLIRMNLGDALTILVTHAERHAGQIERTRLSLL